MQKQDAQVCTAIDVGSNTIRVVVARCSSGGLEILATDEAIVRIGESVNSDGLISDEKRDLTITVLRQFRELAQKHEAGVILAIATEAIRKASNRDAFLQAIKDDTGIDVHCIGGDIEATLTFYGVTYALAKDPEAPSTVAVMDLGGGSTELVLAKSMHIYWHTSLPIGSGWLHDRYLTADPPTHDDNVTARSFLRTYLRGLNVKRFPPVLYATGGSANTLLLMAQRAFDLDAASDVLTHDDLVRCEGLLWALPAEEIAQRYQIDVKRVRMIAAGVLVLQAMLERFHLTELHISSNGIREGLALAYARYGDQWLEMGQKDAQASTQNAQQITTETPRTAYTEPFVQAGARMLRERAQAMFSWRTAVLKNEDVEAVHKMRVASRRLRAVMDAYESVADRKRFRPLYRLVKETADVLGAARDTDVMIGNLRQRIEEASAEEQSALRWLIARLITYREQHQHKLVAHIEQLDEAVFMKQLDGCLRQRDV
jgi:exopolyphosphatase/pppGpp-phosphohydrolase